MLTKKRIGVLAGGISAEREVSLRSGNAVFKALQSKGYNVVLIDTRENLWDSIRQNKIEIAFLALHGGYGENGAIQGLLEVMGIPYTGSGILASALAMDKEASKKIFLYHNIPISPFIVIQNDENISELKTGFEMPWVIKPVSEGSSIGVSIVKREDEIKDAMDKAFAYGEKILIEKYIKGREIQIGILGQQVLGAVEVIPSTEFYSYEAKYTPGLTRYILPPELDETLYNKLKMLALASHCALGCKGATRVDLILDGSNNPYVLEVNTIPGMTETSLLPKIARLAGLDFGDLIEEIIRISLKDNI